MHINSTSHPLLILKEIDNACREVIGNKSEPANSNIWSGLNFQILGDELLIQNIYVNEILDANIRQSLSTMPGAKPWLLGLISLKGQPIPVIDLKQYLFNEPSKPMKNSRLIVINHDDLVFGLLLEEVHGLKQFSITPDIEVIDFSSFSKKNRIYVDKIFTDSGLIYGNFSIPKLTSDTEFANAAR